MKLSPLCTCMLLHGAVATRLFEPKASKAKSAKADSKASKAASAIVFKSGKAEKMEPPADTVGSDGTSKGGMNTAPTPVAGEENSIQLLRREGIIGAVPTSLCEKFRGTEEEPAKQGKNVILVVGDGMGWEMIRAGAIAKQVIKELELMGVDVNNGSTGEVAEKAKAAFAGRSLTDYYTEGKGSGLSFQDLPDFHVMTTTVPIIGAPNDGNHYGPARSFLGNVEEHDNGMAELITDEQGTPLVFDARDVMKGGNLVQWDDVKGGKYPWDENYFKAAEGFPTDPNFDPEFILQHAIDSANSASHYATGVKTGVNQMGVDLYERPVRNILEEALTCNKSGGIMSSVPILHATPAAFVTHTNYRKNQHHLQDGFKETQPTWAMGTCASRYQPSEELKQSMINGSLASSHTFLHQDPEVQAENFYDSIQDKDPDNGDHVLSCFGGQYSTGDDLNNMPYRGLDSSYTNRWCSKGIMDKDADDVTIGITPNVTMCDHWPEEELKNVPAMSQHVKEAIKFLGKDDDGFFLMYEQGDIDWAAHADHLDDLLGAMLDIDDSVAEIKEWIESNGGYEKNALYVTADHDHYLTLLPHFPEIVANMIIDGVSHNITPESNTNTNAWSEAILSDRHNDASKTQTEHLKDFTTWTDADIQNVAHFFGPPGSGGNGWGSHSTRPVVVHHGGDDGCLHALVGKGYRILGREVEGSSDKLDQVHLHACMMKQLFGL